MEESKTEVKMDVFVKSEDADAMKNDTEDPATNDDTETGGEATSNDVPKEAVAENAVKEESNNTAKTEEDPSAPEPPLKKKRSSKTPTAAPPRERRERKSVESFDPVVVPVRARSVASRIVGRGTRLGDLAACVAAMEAHAMHLPVAYRLVYKPKAAAKKKEMMHDLLEFSGYLPPKDASLKEEEQEERDDEVEAKMGAKAYKLTLPQVKSLCDFFGVDRRTLTSKDDVVDQLLDFLSEPSAETLVSTTTKKRGKKTKTKGKRNASKTKTDMEEDDPDDAIDKDDPDYDDVDDDKLKADDDADDRNGKSSPMPNQDKLRKWVRAYVRCFHETKLTVNHALEIASEKFGVDLTPKKAELRKLLIDEL